MADVGRLLHPEDRDRLLVAFPPAYQPVDKMPPAHERHKMLRLPGA